MNKTKHIEERIYYIAVKSFFYDERSAASFIGQEILKIPAIVMNDTRIAFEMAKRMNKLMYKRFRIGVSFRVCFFTMSESYSALEEILWYVTEDYVITNSIKKKAQFLFLDENLHKHLKKG